MKRILLFSFFIFAASLFLFVPKIHSDELDDINKKISDLTSQLNQSVNATRPLESQLENLQKQIADIKARVVLIEDDVATKKKNIDIQYNELAKQEEIFNSTVRDLYIKSYNNSPIFTFLASKSAKELVQTLAYQEVVSEQEKTTIIAIAQSIQDLEVKKKNLENEEIRLAAVKATLDEESAKLDKVVSGAKAYQATLTNQIAQLSAQQQSLLASKLASLGLPTSAYTTQGGCADDRTINPGFSPGLAFYTYGVPNRVGLNQYGAWGRAKAGQDYSTILQAYYNFDSISDANQGTQIHVQGNGIDTTLSLEDYVKRIYEVPDSWTDNNLAALKAQAIAARSYALAYTNNGGSAICPTDACQVFQTNPKGGNWEQAVNQTAGKVMIQSGKPIKAWFSSTHGGYVFNSGSIGWSGTSYTKNALDASGPVNSFADLQSKSYDRDSKWFYCDWGSRAGYSKTAWLKPEEVADIVNVISLLQNDSSLKEHLYQTDKPNPAGTDTWDAGRVQSELKNRGGTAFSAISDVNVSADFGSGRTTTVNINGDAGSKSFPGDLFKIYFNIRAPSNINIVGPLYNVEKR